MAALLLLLASLGLSSASKPTLGLSSASKPTLGLSNYFDLEWIAYGGAKTHGSEEEGYTFECQHGPRECAGNIVQGCTTHHVTDMVAQVELLNCMAAAPQPEEAGELCFLEFGVDWRPVQECIEGPEGAAIHAQNGVIQGSLEPRVWGVPWPLWDGVGGDEVMKETDALGVVGYLCKYYYDNSLPGGVCTQE